MATEKQETVVDDVRILNKINKRLDTIEETNKKLVDSQKDQKRRLTNQINNQKEEIQQFQDDCKEIDNNIKFLTKNIFDIGKHLKDKISKDEMEYLESEIDKWPLEQFITHKELNKTYSHYSKK